MPIITVKKADKVWEKDDRRIYELQVELNGKLMKAKTYSDAIGVEGWAGDVVSYDKPGRNGVEKFLKQAPKEEGYGSKPSYQPKDEASIQAQMAIKAAVQMGGIVDVTDQDETAKYLIGVENAAKELFAMIGRVKDSLDTVVEVEDTDEPINIPDEWEDIST